METLLIQRNDLQISSRPVWNRHFHFGGYAVEPEVDSQPPTVVDAQSQHAPPPKPLADLRTLYQQTSSKNKSRFNASNASSSTKDFEDTMKLPSERTLKPILNLIIPTTASFKPDIIHGITTRLDVETSLFLIGKSLGILEHWSETVFRDPRARPNFFRGIMTHNLTAGQYSPEDGNTISLDDRVKMQLRDELRTRKPAGKPFIVNYDGRGELTFGLPSLIPSKTLIDKMKGKASYDYMTNTLLRAAELGTRLISLERLLIVSLRQASLISMLGGMTALLECTFQDLKNKLHSDASTKQLFELLMHELSTLFYAESREVPRSRIEAWIQGYLDKVAGDAGDSGKSGLSQTLLNMRLGVDSTQDYAMGWIVKRCKERGIACPIHESVMAILRDKSEQWTDRLIAEHKFTTHAQKTLEVADQRIRNHTRGTRGDARAASDPEPEYRDKVEIQRQKRLEKRRAGLGKQPIPKHFVAPNISPLGNTTIERQKEEK